MIIKESIHVISNNLCLRNEDMCDDDAGILENVMKELNLKEKSTQNEDKGIDDDE